jgi:hypothetical protein
LGVTGTPARRGYDMKTKDLKKKTRKLKKRVGKRLEKALETGSENKGKTIAAAGIATVGLVGVGVAAVLARRKDGVVTYHVQPAEEGGWSITAEGEGHPLGLYGHKRAAVADARAAATESRPSALVIHGKDGTIQKTHAYGTES